MHLSKSSLSFNPIQNAVQTNKEAHNGFVFLCMYISRWQLESVGILEWNCTVIVYVHVRAYTTLSINLRR